MKFSFNPVLLAIALGLLALAGCGEPDSPAQDVVLVDAPAAKAGQGQQKPKGKSKGKIERQPGQPMPYFGDLPSLAKINIRDVVLEEVTTELDFPWAMEFLPDGDILINEAAGTLKRLYLPEKRLAEVSGLPEIPHGKGQLGLMDLVLHPDFVTNGLVYFSHAVGAEPQPEKPLYGTAVTRARLDGERLLEVERLFTTSPLAGQTANFGGALEFDEQGYLLIGTGDRGRGFRAQETQNLNGKIIRLDEDGGVPRDNPFVGNPAVDDRIFAIGVRNPQGLVRDPVTQLIYETEHGPMGGDEVNIIESGKNYGWPTITYGANYNTQRVGSGTALEGLEQPLFYFLPSLATSPITIYRGQMFPEWEGDLFIGMLKGAQINRLDMVEGVVKSRQSILREIEARIRDIKVAPDGSLYVLAQNDTLYRLYRAPGREDLEYPPERKGQVVYRTVCTTCHSAGGKLIPQLNDPEAWEERLARGKEALYRHTIEGYGAMPPRGLCETCTDQELKLAVDHMLKWIRPALKAHRNKRDNKNAKKQE
jgi:glucose/arabinose dehydrogenase